MSVDISIKTKSVLSIDGAGDIEINCYSFRENGDLYVEVSRDEVANWLTKTLVLKGFSFDYRVMSKDTPTEVHAVIIRSGR